MKLPCPLRYAADSSHAAKLLKLLGPEKFAALQKAFGGRRIWVPKKGKPLTCSLCRKRDECIQAWRKKGHRVSRIAGHLCLSSKSVYRILSTRAKGAR